MTPIFEGDNLVASGAQMEAMSVEDNGEGICFNIYAYNNQPGITIDYATGESWLEGSETDGKNAETSYILNTSSRKFHDPDCGNVNSIKKENKKVYTGSRKDLMEQNYTPCGQCKP